MHDMQIDHLIVNIIQTQKIAEQSELQQCLLEKGHDMPQATLSRRLKKLNIAKVAGFYQVIAAYNPVGLPLVLNLQVSDYGLIVLHTQPGNANSLAYYFDRKYVAFNAQSMAVPSGILGTIAGDDTVLLIVKSPADLEKVKEVLRGEFPYLVVT